MPSSSIGSHGARWCPSADLRLQRLSSPLSRTAATCLASGPPRLEIGTTAPSIVSVGRLERYKGHHRAISALPAVLAERPDARLRIVGAGPYETELRRLANRLGVAGRVDIGPIPPSDRVGMASALGEASLILLLSDYEANPVSVLEALGMERPVLVTYTSGLGELADRGLVRAIPLTSSDEQVAKAILAELESPLQRTHVALPSWDQCTADLLDLYRRVLGTANAS